jgi:short-subunit dehydrogenase
MTEQRHAIALITGASSGIGLELARIFAAEGYEFIMCSHDSVKLANAANEVAAAEDGV